MSSKQSRQATSSEMTSARKALGGSPTTTQIAQYLSSTTGQPVSIGSVSATPVSSSQVQKTVSDFARMGTVITEEQARKMLGGQDIVGKEAMEAGVKGSDALSQIKRNFETQGIKLTDVEAKRLLAGEDITGKEAEAIQVTLMVFQSLTEMRRI